MSTYKDLLREMFWHFVGVAISFALIYWLATDNLWLCFFLASALTGGQLVARTTKREIFEFLLPIQQSIDDNINSLHYKCQALEEEVEELKDKLQDLESKFDELNEQVNPPTY